MKHHITITALAMTMLVTVACRKNKSENTTDWTSSPHPVGAERARGAPAVHKREPAGGELRDTLLLLQRVQFGFDTAELSPHARESLEQAAVRLSRHPDVVLYVEGHTDERGTTEYNVALGERRAEVVIDYLARMGVDRARLSPISFGEERPRRDGEGAEAMAANRRVEFRLMRGDIQLVLEDGTLVGDDGAPLDGRTAEAR